MDQVEQFFDDVLEVEGYKLLWLLGSQSGRKRSFWFEDATNIAQQVVGVRESEFHAYFGVGSRKNDLGPYVRGERDDYYQYKALWLDIDVLGDNHKSDRLPPTTDAGMELIRRMPLEPSYVVNSGGGLQAYWVLTEPATADEMDQFLPAWACTWKAFGEERGWHVDNVFDLARVMRAPGSLNKKNDAPVAIVAHSPAVYNLDDFDPYLREPEPVQISAPRDPGAPERPGDAYNRRAHIDPVGHAAEILEGYGFSAQRQKLNGELPYVRPGKSERETSSATIYPDGHCTIYSSDPSLPTTMADKVGKPLDPFGLYTMFVHEGDWEKATATLREQGFGDPVEGSDALWILDDIEVDNLKAPVPPLLDELADADPTKSTWEYDTLFDLADAPPEEPPSVGQREDDVFLLYKGKVHTVNGEPGGMKSWFTQLCAKQSVEVGENVLIIDYENSKRSIYDRFRYLAVSGDDLKRIHITTPDTPFGPAERKALEARCVEYAYELIVVDGTTDAMVAFGFDPSDSVGAAKFDKAFLKPLAATGAAVIYVDHVTKDKETRGSWGFGSQHKKSAIDGASFGIDPISSFGKGMHGRARGIIHKDKPGDLLQHALDGVHTPIFEIDMISDPETNQISARLTAPSYENNPNFRPTHIMDTLWKYIAANPGLSKDVIITAAGLTTAKTDWVKVAFEKLEAEGYIHGDLGSPRDRRWRADKDKHYNEMQDFLDHHGGIGEVRPGVEDSMARLRKQMERENPDSGENDVPPAPVVVNYVNEGTSAVPTGEQVPQGVALEDLL